MKVLLSTIVAMTLATPVLAGPGHGHSHNHSHEPKKVVKCAASSCTETEVKGAIVSKVIPSYISKKKLAESWTSAAITSVTRKKFKGNLEWALANPR